jgi:hypothetical protein
MLRSIAASGIAMAAAMSLAYAGSPHKCLLQHELAHAGGWGADHPGAIYTKACGRLPMPPHAFPLNGRKAVVHSIPNGEIFWHCGYAQACSTIGGDPALIWLPIR